MARSRIESSVQCAARSIGRAESAEAVGATVLARDGAGDSVMLAQDGAGDSGDERGAGADAFATSAQDGASGDVAACGTAAGAVLASTEADPDDGARGGKIPQGGEGRVSQPARHTPPAPPPREANRGAACRG